MVADREILERRLVYLRAKLADLEPYGPADRGRVLGDKILYGFLEHTIHQAVECAIDIGAHVVASEGLAPADTNAQILGALGARGVISAELASRLADAARQRNVLVHLYLDVDRNKVFDALLELKVDLPAFGREIKAWLERSG